ncbi:MAG: class I SAM-dependent methyltransferase [Erythrobacter sp.]|jgi:hypothetical protein|nr:class I SAM-dependent methyltransferase [Erythrobacter sp.]
MLKAMVDILAAAVVTLGAPLFRKVGNWPGGYPRYLRQADRAGVHWRSTHYYQPTYRNSDLPDRVDHERDLPGIDLNIDGQLALLSQFAFEQELSRLDAGSGELAYSFDNNQYGAGDAQALYSMIRHLKPRRLIEIGSGNSTKIAAMAIAANETQETGYCCEHICIEPYEMPWLEALGPRVIRQRVEEMDPAFFRTLRENDILFIDSSHVIRPFGDVLFEFQSIIPLLNKGVFVHVHDIFTPRDYPEKWLRDDRRLWNEQYLLEVLLQNSARYRTVLALNWLRNNRLSELTAAFGNGDRLSASQPGAYWFEVIG